MSSIPSPPPEAFVRGVNAAQQGLWSAAAEAFALACQEHPEHAPSWINWAISLERSGAPEACDIALQQGLGRHPKHPALLLHAGQRALARDALQEAEEQLRRSLAQAPQLRGAQQLLAVCLLEQQRPEAALSILAEILRAEPANPAALYNRGLGLKARGDWDQALASWQELTNSHPQWPGLETNRGALLLQLGRWSEGWPLYEARFRDTPEICLAPALPRYAPAARQVSQLLLVAEQGLGDSLQFLRYGPLLRERCETLLLAVQPPLLQLARQSGFFDQVLPLEALKDRTQLEPLRRGGCQWLPLLSAAALAGAGSRAAPPSTPLRADPEAIGRWGERLGPRQKRRRIALVWQGNPEAERGQQRGRSMPLACLRPLLQDPQLEWISLQKGPGSEQLDALGLRPLFHPAQGEIDPVWEFSDIAALLSHCDLLLSTDTAITHLAGAYAIPSLLLLKAVPDWRWGIAGSHCPWYPGHQLFRQHPGESWDQTVGRLAASGLLHNPATSR